MARTDPRVTTERRTEIVFPQDSNAYGNLFGGKAVSMMDVVGGIAATRACRKPVVTVSIDRIDFKQPIRTGEFVDTVAHVVKLGRTSIGVEVELWGEHPTTGERRLATVGKFIYVAVTPDGKPTPVQGDDANP